MFYAVQFFEPCDTYKDNKNKKIKKAVYTSVHLQIFPLVSIHIKLIHCKFSILSHF